MRRFQELDETVELKEQIRPRGCGKRRGLPERLPDILNRRSQPPNQPPPPLQPGCGPRIDPQPPPSPDGDEEYDDIQLLGRDAGYDVDDFDAIMNALRRTPGSTNVCGYFFARESRRSGMLYVTFLRTTLDGEYVPRKTSPYGFVNRAVPVLGIGRRSYRRNTLTPIRWGRSPNNGRPDPGHPDRGEPDRGDPNRGSPF